MIKVHVRKGTEDYEVSRKKGLKMIRIQSILTGTIQVEETEDDEGSCWNVLKTIRRQI
jgi:hypothetical protein